MGKVVAINVGVNRYEYRYSAYQLVLVDGGYGARGDRGQTAFRTPFVDGKHTRWERYDVLDEIKPRKMPDWAREVLSKIKEQEKTKKTESREER